MRKTLVYVTILALLSFSVWYFLFNTKENPYGETEAGFTIKDTAAIGRIFLVSSSGESITLDRTDQGWMVNKKHRALRSTLDLLLTTMHQQVALYPVTKSAYENVVKTLSTNSTKVELYKRDGSPISTFYVGGIAVNNTGTNMLMKDAHQPYVVHVQGFNGYLTPRYTTRMTDWRDRTVFNIPEDEIKTISVQYADKQINSFVIAKDKDSVTVTADKEIMTKLDGLNKRRAVTYTRYFTNVNCEGYLNGLEDMDATLKTAPKQSSIDITGIHGQHQHADIYWMAVNRRSKNRETSNKDVPDDYDSDRLYAVINDAKDTIMIQQYAFRNIFHKAYEFYLKDGEAPKLQKNPRQPIRTLETSK